LIRCDGTATLDSTRLARERGATEPSAKRFAACATEHLQNSLALKPFWDASRELRGPMRVDDTSAWLADSVTPRKSKRRVSTGASYDISEGALGDSIPVAASPSALTPQKVEVRQDDINVKSRCRFYRYERAVDIASPSFRMIRGLDRISIPLGQVDGKRLAVGSISDAPAKKHMKARDGGLNVGEQDYISASGRADANDKFIIDRGVLQSNMPKSVALKFRGINIQWPFSQLLLLHVKNTEVRNYALGFRKIGLENQDSRIRIWGVVVDYK